MFYILSSHHKCNFFSIAKKQIILCTVLQVFHLLKLGEGQDITALALNKDNTNLLVSTADKQLIVFTDPAVS